MTSKISVHHVGGRDGDFPFRPPARFNQDIHLTLYEVDEEAMADGDAALTERGINHTFVPHAIWSEATELTLHVTYCPYATSILPFKQSSPGITEIVRGTDYLHHDTFQTVATPRISTRTIDDICDQSDGPVSPDILTIDTQGAELEILKGAANAVSETVLAVVAELAIVQSYEGQPLISDICRHLDDAGFTFMRKLDEHLGFIHRAPLGFRAAGCEYEIDGLFLLRLDQISRVDDEARCKLAFIAASFGHIDYMAAVLEITRTEEVELTTHYSKFAAAASGALAAMPAITLQSYADTWTAEEARLLTPTSPFLDSHDDLVRQLLETRPEIVEGMTFLSTQENTPIEECLLAFDMVDQAALTKKTRLEHVSLYAQYLKLI